MWSVNPNIVSSSRRAKNSNYYHPLQALSDDNITDNGDKDDSAQFATKSHIPPITILKSNLETIKTICKEHNVLQYSIRKISIGHKLFCELLYDYDNVIKSLKDKNVEFFSYCSKNNRPFKVILSGLDKMDVKVLKNELIKEGLCCLDVKPVFRKANHNREIILYVVYLKKGSTSLKDLKENHNSLNYIRIKWSHKTRLPSQLTQCYNCQMFGHGSNNCNVKTFCANCAGSHLTTSCTATITKCANCHGSHKSTDKDCPNRTSYIGFRSRYSGKTRNSTLPNRTVNQNTIPVTNAWTNSNRLIEQMHGSPSHNDLFSLEELQKLTLELIGLMKNCKTKVDQFNIVTSLAYKFLP